MPSTSLPFVSASMYPLAENVTRDILPNGLTLLIKENHNAPVVALLATVRIGYFNEPDRVNGITHVVEHMLFKGTDRRPEDEQIAREVRMLGGVLNASTYYEETTYYIVVPGDKMEAAMELQADMFQHTRFDAASLAKEIEVIVQESLQKRDNPTAMLVESLHELAHDRHRIRRWRIGHPETLRAMTRDDLATFVQQTYRPENIILAVVGAIETAQAQALVRRYWGDFPRGALQKENSEAEPTRHDFRYRRLRGETRQRLVLFTHPAPPILHPDAVPLMVLSALLSDGRSARLYRRLKEELRLVSSAWSSYEGFQEMGLFTLGAECLEDDPLPVEQALRAEIRRIQQEPVGEEELARIKQRVESRRLYAQEEVLGIARALANYQGLGDYHLADELLVRLRAVSIEEVRQVANHYLNLEGAALLEYLPQSETAIPERTTDEIRAALEGGEVSAVREEKAGEKGEGKREEEKERQEAGEKSTPGSRETESGTPKSIPVAGVGTLLYKRRNDLPIVSITVLVRGGKRWETRANCGITSLMLRSSMKGTRTMTAEQIANRIESIGSGIGNSLAADYLGYGMKITRESLAEGFEVFRDVLMEPTFPAEEVEREKQAMFADLRRQQDSSVSLAFDLFAETCYGDQHPYGLPSIGIAEAISTLSPTDLAAWHTQHFNRGHLIVAIVGDLTEAEAIALCESLKRDAGKEEEREGKREKGRGESKEREEQAEELAPPGVSTVKMPERPPQKRVLQRDKKQTATVLGFPGATPYNPDRYALDVLAEIVSGMGGRFFRVVRGENALAYSVSGFHRTRMDAGNFIAYASTAPENEALAYDLLLAECERLGKEPVTENELSMAKSVLVGEHVIGTQTYGAQAGELAGTGIYGLPLDEPQRYLAEIQAVTAEQVRDVAARYLRTEQLWTAIVRGGVPEGYNEGQSVS